MITLRGMTWAHTRGYVPMVATAQRYQELHPDVRVQWETRSLKDFEEYPVEELAARYDLMVIDHPFIGYAAQHQVFLPLDTLLPASFLADQAANSVGASHASYAWEGHHWALAIDTAAPVAAWRPDLLERFGLRRPKTWTEVLALAREGFVDVPAVPINCLMNFFALCIAAGEAPFQTRERVAGEAGRQALEWLGELVRACSSHCLERNPIHCLERLASAGNDRLACCLFPYGYSNYAREGYAAQVVHFGDVPAGPAGGGPMTTVLGGTGLAISSRCAHVTAAADYAAFVASPGIQRTLYTHSGGQPGHRTAWLDAENNRRTHDYFRQTLPALDRAFVRPRYPNYLHGFQEVAGPVVHRCVRGETDARATLAALDSLYLRSLSAPHASS